MNAKLGSGIIHRYPSSPCPVMQNLSPEATGSSAANASRHLALLAQHGLLSREVRGTSVYYAIADPAVYELCNLVCDNLARRVERTAPQRAAFATLRPRARRRAATAR